MMGFSRNHSGDRFYNPPAVRRQQQQLLQQRRQQQQQQKLKDSASDAGEAENRVEVEDSRTKPSVRGAQPRPSAGNLDRFIEFTTPLVPAQCLSRTSVKGWRNGDSEIQPYFTLGDLWESFKEWSAYGAGVPLVLNGCENVIQYYVPYLSGIQLYVDPSMPALSSRRPIDESDSDSFESSGESSDSDAEKQCKMVAEAHNVMESSILRIGKLSLSKPSDRQEGFSSDDGDSPQSQPVFEYLETDPPYSREPLADKISMLACRFPELKTLNSCNLLPSSWISVAWYPIYRIPMGPTLKDLDACFLTYHSLSTPIRRGSKGQPHLSYSASKNHGSLVDTSPKLSLPIFGLASYKFRASVWNANGATDHQQASSLLQEAENWLRLLRVDHPDFRFFHSHNSYGR